LGLTVFGTVPALIPSEKTRINKSKGLGKSASGKSGYDDKLLTRYSEKSPIAEAYRSLKTSIQFLAHDKSKKVFVISSPGSSEGKSLTTVNTGISFANGGQRVLIIDADLRRPVQHKYFDFHRRPGLTNYLFDEVQLSDILRETPVPNLYLISAGNSPPNPAELVASRKMKDFIQEVSNQFDIVLVDSPPIMACVDSRVIAESTDGMILLAQMESTSLREFAHAVNLCRKLNVEICGVILNLVEFRYGYSYYYAYRYYNPFSYYYYSGNYYYYYEEGESKGKKMKRKKGMITGAGT
jgi:capsular exopolysaccharide synthesis family protein